MQGLALWFSDFWHRHIYLNFIAEERWHYLTSGLINTLVITFFALLLGTLLGAVVAVVRVTHDKAERPGLGVRVLNRICKVYLTVIRGTPVMVQLLIIYYAIFASVDINEVLVACLAFGINSGAYVAEVFRSGIMSIDPGQPYSTVMLRVIMPQAIKNILPALGNEFIALLKETSVAGYIAIRDLTKGADIIRSQTWDAFVPLLAAAAIYLALVMLLEKGVHMLEGRLAQSDRG